MDKFIESARSTAGLAYKAKQAGKLGESARLFTNAGMEFLRIAVGECADVEEGVKFLNAENLPTLLSDGAETNVRLIAAVRSGQATAIELLGKYMFLVLSDVAALVGARAAAREFADVAAAKEVSGTRFWDAYAECHSTFLAGKIFDVPILAVRGPEKYWLPYIELMARLNQGAAIDEKRKELESLFAKRNSDKRFVTADAYEIEGSPQRQAKWDFRLHGLLKKKNA